MDTLKESQNPIEEILLKYNQGSTRDYDRFVSQLASPNIESATLLASLRALKKCILLLGVQFETLVGVILKIDWVGRESAVVKEYQSFLVNLISAHTLYLKACVRMLVRHFMPKAKPADDEIVEQSVRLQDDLTYNYVHATLHAIIKIVPMTPTVLLPLVSENFPYLTKHAYIQECYVRNLLQVSSYLPTHRTKLLELIFDKMTKLDVRSPRDEVLEAESKSDEEDEDKEGIVFEMDDVEMEIQMSTGPTPGERTGPMSHKVADKLDILMNLTCIYIYNTCHPNGVFCWEATKKLYRELLLIFDRIILPTYASCHVQFILFYVCSFKEALAEGFIDYLWKKVQDPNTQVVFRQTAVAYLASLCARAKYVPISMVRTCLELMSKWAHYYIEQAVHSNSPDVTHHRAFFSVTQAIFYVIAFRHKDLFSSPKEVKHVERFNLQGIVTSRLNPLKFCLPTIAKTFASITRSHQVAFCDTILERNKRAKIPVEGAITLMGEQMCYNPLDSFFPFDPFLLNRSGEFIKPLYREYEGSVVVDNDDVDEMQEEEYYSKECGSVEEGMNFAKFAKSPLSPTELMMYGTSPGFKGIGT